ncbi:MAG: substrate-binding domain-containing protein [Magnetococcales bacterium]|nr:substrate-binding domain-containing protein [Magnetococcales bacterium]
MKIYFQVVLVLLILPLFFSVDGVKASALTDELKGPAFSDPDKVARKPERWIKTPIKYGKWAKGADVAVTLDQRQFYIFESHIEQYAKKNKIQIATKDGTCGITEGTLSRKKADIGGLCCQPAAYDRWPGLKFNTIGMGALAIVVHKDNPIENVTVDQVRQIFQGKILKWSELTTPSGKPGPDIHIRPIARLHCKLRPGHWRLILDNEDHFGAQLSEVGTPPDQILTGISGYPGAVGYEAVWNIDRFYKIAPTKALKVDGVSPYDLRALIEGKYPFYRVFNLTTWEQPGVRNTEAEKLVKYLIKLIGDQDLDDNPYLMAPSWRLRKAGWKFRELELIGEIN